MAYRVGSVVVVGDSASTTRVVSRPAGAALNDIIVLRFYVENLTLTPSLSPGSWTKITASSGEQPSGTPFEVHDYWSRQGAESGSITITWGGASVWNTALAGAWDGRVTSGDPLNGTSTFTLGNGTIATATGLTTGNIDADLIGFASNGIGSGWAWSGLTMRGDLGGQSIATDFQTPAGATGDKTATMLTGNWAASLIALRAADQPAPPSYPGANIWRRQPGFRIQSSDLVRNATGDVAQEVAGRFFEAAGTSDVTVGLTGVTGTGAVGSLSLATTKALTGNTATGAIGTITANTGSPDVTVGLTGVAGTGSAGSVGTGTSRALTGNSATGAAGTLGLSQTRALTGVAGTGAAGTLATATSKALTGVAGTGASGSLLSATSKALTGNAATGSVGILAHSRTRALTGVSGTGSAGSLTVQSAVVAPPDEIVFTLTLVRKRSLTAAIATTAIRAMAVTKMATKVTKLNRSGVRRANITKNIRITEQR